MPPEALRDENEREAYSEWKKHLSVVGETENDAYVIFRPKGLFIDHAQSSDHLVARRVGNNGYNGGIDFNSNNMQMNVRKGNGIAMRLDPAMIARLKTQGFDGLEFHIQSIIPVTDLPVFLGLGSDKEVRLALN